MSHGQYIFLMDLNIEDATPKDIISDWESYYVEGHTDENNWNTVHTIYIGDKIYNFDNKNQKWVEVSKVCAANFVDPFLYALRIAARDLGLFNVSGISIGGEDSREEKRIDSLTATELINVICTEIPKGLAEAYQKAIGVKPSGDYSTDNYNRRQTSQGFERFLQSDIPPFSACICSPYDWRCYDLRNNSYGPKFNPKKSVILIADIHT